MCDDKPKPNRQEAKGADFLAGDALAMRQWQNFHKYRTANPTKEDIAAYKANKDQPKNPHR